MRKFIRRFILCWAAVSLSLWPLCLQVMAQVIDSQDVRAFVGVRHIHGIPRAEAQKLGRGAVVTLKAMLADPSEVDSWANIIETLGYIGGDEARDALFHFESVARGPVGHSEFKALILVPVALSHMAADGDPVAREYLENIARLDASPADSLRWSYDSYVGVGLVHLFAELGVSGLEEVGDLRAKKFLRKLRKYFSLIYEQKFLVDDIDSALRELESRRGESYSFDGKGRTKHKRVKSRKPAKPKMLPCGGSAPSGNPSAKDYTVNVAVHTSVNLKQDEMESILNAMSKLLKIDDMVCSDVACPVGFLPGGLSPFGAAGDGLDVINSQQKLLAVLAESGTFKVVDSITYCKGSGGNFLGCSEGGSLVIERRAAPDVWVHEFGHSKLLPDRHTCSKRIMDEEASLTNAVTKGECACLARP